MHHPHEQLHDLSDPTPWRRSARASAERRARTAVSRRRVLRSRGAAVAVTAGFALAAGGAWAADGPASGGASADAPATTAAAATPDASPVAAAQRALGVRADGVLGPHTKAKLRAFQRAHGLPANGRLTAVTLAALGVPATAAPATPRTASGDDATTLAAIAQCESGGDPTAISPSGRYRGKYQFSRATWRAEGGTGDPAAAPEAEQDQRALALLQDQGPDAWPVCAKSAG